MRSMMRAVGNFDNHNENDDRNDDDDVDCAKM